MNNNLKTLRKEKGITQKEVAKYIGINQNTYSYWESGKVKIDNVSLQKLSDFYNVSLDYLLARTDVKEKPADENADELDELLKDPKFKALCERLSALSPEALEIVRAQVALLYRSQEIEPK